MTTQAAIDKVKALRDDFPFFAAANLKITDKGGREVPLVFNEPQRIVHAALEKQKREKGFVRAIVLKARKQGISTYIQARNYHLTSLWKNRNTYILTHEQAASDTIFGMVDYYQAHNPIAPKVGIANEKQLIFERLNSQYTVATAGSKGTGRSQTNHLFHGSEVAFWPNAKDHFKASVQSVPREPGTEIVLESTANGPGGEFYERWQQAIRGQGDYIAIFIPWFASSEYAQEPPEGFELSNEPVDGELSEVDYARMFGLSDAQMLWRRMKVNELGSIAAFRQENPATAEEAFVSADKHSYIDPLTCLLARKRKVAPGGPLIVGVDPAGAGGDRFSIAWRRGYVVEKVEWRDKLSEVAAVAWMKEIIDTDKPARMFIDSGGLGAPIIGFLKSAGPTYAKTVMGVNFGSTSQAKNARPNVAGPKNRRAEMWMRMRQWLKQEEGVQIPDRDVIQSDLTGPWVKNDLNNDLQLSSKEEMKAKQIRSPDLADAMALTFAESVWVEPPRTERDGSVAASPAFAPLDSVRKPDYGYSMPPFRGGGGPAGWMR